MLLTEIFGIKPAEKLLLEYSFPKIQWVDVAAQRHPGRSLSNTSHRDNNNVNYLGGGSFALAYSNLSRSPQDIRKVSSLPRSSRQLDGFFYYIKALENNSDNTNPYFPRFRQIKVYVDRDEDSTKDKITYSVQMERLHELMELSQAETDAILLRIYGENIDDAMELLNLERHPYGLELLTIVRQATERMGSELNELIVDEEFIHAMAFIKAVSNKYNIGLDLHDENIMIRRGPTGVHLVFTDPLSYVHSDIDYHDNITADD